jgi:hypothetical protein
VGEVAEVQPMTAAAALEAGDEAWFSGARADGMRAWRAALRAADTDTADGLALSGQARLRLLRGGSTWSPLVHARGINDALRRCPESEPRCRLLFVDFELLAPPGVGDVAIGLEGAQAIALENPAASASRRALATGDRSPVEAMPAEARDGLGRALIAGRVPEPGLWTVVPLFSAGPPIGLGGGVHFSHPDVFRRAVSVSLDGMLGVQGHSASALVVIPGRPRWVASASSFEVPFGVSEGGVPVPRYVARRVGFGPVWQVGPRWSVGVTAAARWDGIGVLSAGHELAASATRTPSGGKGWGLTASLATTVPGITGYARQFASVEGRVYAPLGPVVWASRLRGEGVLGDPPPIRLPSVGGGDLLRGAAYGADRGRWLVGADTELRIPLKVVSPVVFGDGAVVEGRLHGGAGVGVRLPAGTTTLGMDFGWTDLGYGFAIRYGEVF